MLASRLTKEGEKTYYFGYPNYDSPTGRIIGLAYLGKKYLGEYLVDENKNKVMESMSAYLTSSHDKEIVEKALLEVSKEIVGWFKEGAVNVDPKIASAYYAIDRAYNASKVEEMLKSGNVVMDRYIYSNMGHQGGKIKTSKERKEFYDWNLRLELEMFGLRKDDIRIFLHVPTIYTGLIKGEREEALDEHERSEEHLRNAEESYMQLINYYDFNTIDCLHQMSDPIKLSDVKTPDEIHEEVYNEVVKALKLR